MKYFRLINVNQTVAVIVLIVPVVLIVLIPEVTLNTKVAFGKQKEPFSLTHGLWRMPIQGV